MLSTLTFVVLGLVSQLEDLIRKVFYNNDLTEASTAPFVDASSVH